MIGQNLGHYRVLEKIGSGGMGDVYRANDDRLGRDVAIKVLHSAFAHDRDRLRRFELEARSSAALSHPHIVAIYDIGLHNGAPYIVSELLQGQTLRQRLQQGQLSMRQSADYGIQIAQGLMAAHDRGIVHRDLKPENLFITRDRHIKILDFGIAKLTSSEGREEQSIETMATQTKAGSVLGTVRYMSPEQLRGKAIDHRSDIFSFGAILYEMLTGKYAFLGDTEVDTMMSVLREEPAEMTLTRAGIAPAFEQIVRHCLEKEPEGRFQSARDLAFALSTVSNVTTKPVIPARWQTTGIGKWLFWVAGALALAAAGIVLGIRVRPASSPSYTRITFERGTVYWARFSHKGQGILYDASWNGTPLQLYSTVGDSPLARPLGFLSADMLALSRMDELALLLRGTPERLEFTGGVLARAPLAGGTPRELLEDVRGADWSPQGDLAVVHHANGKDRLEYPIGKVLYETSGWINGIRFSPRGDRIAFMDHPAVWDDRGSVCVVDLNGTKNTLSSGWESENGLAWAPSGEEIWFTAAENSSSTRSVWAVNLGGRRRLVLNIPGGFTLQDIAQDGRVMVTADTQRAVMEWIGANRQATDLSWYDWSIARGISNDGQWVLFEESSDPAGPTYAVALRNVDGAPPIRLGDGSVGGLSPDGKWAVSVFTGTPQHITLYPVGPGQIRQMTVPGLAHLENEGAHFLADGQHLVIDGNETGRPSRSFLIDLSGGKIRPITPEGNHAGFPSPDGKYLIEKESDHKFGLLPLDGGALIPIAGSGAPYEIVGWSGDSKALFICSPQGVPLRVERLDLATGTRTFLRDLKPRASAGVITIAPVVANSDGSEFAYSYFQALSVLYVVTGLH